MAKSYDKLLRLLLVGDTGVGKTCLICQYASGEFHHNHVTTIGVDFKMKTVEVDGCFVKMQIWDTAGQERFEAITKQFFTRAQGCVLVYDISSRASFMALTKWLLYVKQYTKGDTAIILVGNKCDLEEKRQVPKAVAQQFANENGFKYYEASAKLSINLNVPFQDISRDILRMEDKESQSSAVKEDIKIDLSQDTNPTDFGIDVEEKKTKKGCC